MMDKKLFKIEKANKIAGLIIDKHITLVKGDWFKAVLLHVQIDNIMAATFIKKEKTHG